MLQSEKYFLVLPPKQKFIHAKLTIIKHKIALTKTDQLAV